jgi:hypothetical protein
VPKPGQVHPAKGRTYIQVADVNYMEESRLAPELSRAKNVLLKKGKEKVCKIKFLA